jgi:hypothetical protein
MLYNILYTCDYGHLFTLLTTFPPFPPFDCRAHCGYTLLLICCVVALCCPSLALHCFPVACGLVVALCLGCSLLSVACAACVAPLGGLLPWLAPVRSLACSLTGRFIILGIIVMIICAGSGVEGCFIIIMGIFGLFLLPVILPLRYLFFEARLIA